MPPLRTIRHVSAGGIIVRRRAGRLSACLIRRTQQGRRVWCLPKGHVEPGETPSQAAVREVREETGMAGAVLARLGAIRYQFRLDARTRCDKRVHFYLLRHTGGRAADHDDEVEQVAWATLAQAPARLAYPGERRMLRRARAWIRLHQRALDEPLR